MLILGALWYELTLWSGTEAELKEIEKLIVSFLWARQKDSALNRVNLETLFCSKQEGGVGLISLIAQVYSLAARFILWVLLEGDHPLQVIMRRRIRELSERKWGIADYLWIWNEFRTIPLKGSVILQNLCRGWNRSKKCIEFRPLRNESEIGE